MHLCFVAYDRPDYYNGPIVNIRRLLPRLVERGHQVSLLVLYRQGSPMAKELPSLGIRCRALKRKRYVEQHVHWLVEQVAALRPDVFVPDLSTPGCYASRWIRAAGIPTVATHRSDDPYYWAMVERFLCSREWAVSGMACVSEDLRQKVAAFDPPRTRLCTIPSGVPLPEEVASQEGPLRLLYLGRLVDEQKRVPALIDALRPVLDAHPAMQATLVGEGPLREALKQQVAGAGLQARVHFSGAVSPDKLPQLLTQHHVLTLLSDYEGTPGAVMDGMAAGLVPVCLDIEGGQGELVVDNETGLLVANRGPSFQEAILRLAQDRPLRLRLARAARRRIERDFTIGRTAELWEGFCKELLAARETPGELAIPRSLRLPPVHPAMARDDVRRPPPWKGFLWHIRVALKRAKDAFKNKKSAI